jgi:hypothetical protein
MTDKSIKELGYMLPFELESYDRDFSEIAIIELYRARA